METHTEVEIYYGPRGTRFKELILSVLKKSGITDKYVKLLLSDKSLKEYSNAFTSKLADPDNNLEVFEQLGDVSANKFIVWYMHKRFPFLKTSDGVKVVARLRINYSAKQKFYEIGNNLGFWEFISATVDEKSKRMKHLIEDTFEAFLGCTEYLLDNFFRPGVGYSIVHDILESIFDKINISLKYENLYDAKTRLKELIDSRSNIDWLTSFPDRKAYISRFLDNNGYLGKIKYEDSYIKTETGEEKRFTRVVYTTNKSGSIVIGEGVANIKPDAHQIAAQNALKYLQSVGIFKPIPEYYKKFR